MTAGTSTFERPPKPQLPPFAGLPDLPAMRELQGRPKWVAWEYTWNDARGVWDKPPLNAKDGRAGSTTNSATWAPYDAAAAFATRRAQAGVGYVLSPDDQESGVDLDDCRDPETGTLQAWAQVAVDFGETYAEVSPSGCGLRFFVRGLVEGRKVDAAQVEIYTGGRYLTVTGRHVPGTPTEIREAPRLIAYLQERADQIRAAQKVAADLARKQEQKKNEKRAQEPPRQTTSERASASARERGPRDGSDFWRTVNDRALANLGAWVTSVFPGARYQSGTGAYRVDQRDLGEGYEEDLSLHPEGIRDFGSGDMGDARDGARSPIDIVRDYLPATDPAAAAMWLCERLSMRPEDIGWRGGAGSSADGPQQQGKEEGAQRHEGNGQKPIPLRWHRDASMDADRPWLVHNLIAEVGKGLLSGQWGSAKTFIALDLSGCVMTGEPFAGRKVMRRGGILFIAPEGAFEIPIRLKGLVEGKMAGTAMMQAAAGERPIDPNDMPFAWIEECPRLVDRDAADTLALTADAAARELRERYDLPLALIIVDTVAAGAGFDDENSAAETQKVMSALERLSHHTGAFVLGVDHFGKAVETGTRGSSAKEAAADTVLAALASRDEAGNISNMRMAVRKVRGARTGLETPYSLDVIEIGQDRFGDPVTTCVVNWQNDREPMVTAVKGKDPWTKSLKTLRDAINNALAGSGKRVRPFGGAGPEVMAARQDDVRQEFYAAYPADGETDAQRAEAKKKAFKRALLQGVENGLIATRDLGAVPHVWLAVEGGE